MQIRTHHFIQKAAALNLEYIAMFISQHIQPGDGLEWIVVGFAYVGKVCEIMSPHKQLGSLPVTSIIIQWTYFLGRSIP